MNIFFRTVLIITAVCIAALTASAQDTKPKGAKLRATGTFEVKVIPAVTAAGEESEIARLTLEKTFSGDIAGTGRGQMLGFPAEPKDTGGYVAIEVVRGAVNGKKGTFALQHIGTMEGGKFHLDIRIVPGSGTGELTGIAGTMSVNIDKNTHFYDLDYTLSAAK